MFGNRHGAKKGGRQEIEVIPWFNNGQRYVRYSTHLLGLSNFHLFSVLHHNCMGELWLWDAVANEEAERCMTPAELVPTHTVRAHPQDGRRSLEPRLSKYPPGSMAMVDRLDRRKTNALKKWNTIAMGVIVVCSKFSAQFDRNPSLNHAFVNGLNRAANSNQQERKGIHSCVSFFLSFC